MSAPSTMMDASQMGCELPEHLRQYYLDVMGIDCWQSQDGFAPTVEQVIEHEKVAPELQSTHNTVVSSESWRTLEQSVASCEACHELCQSRKQTVFGAGSHQANVLVIGEAPNTEEEQQGEPFVGAAGELLTAMLKAIKLNREDVFITNAIKCRPLKDRDPSASESENCRGYLNQQIALIKPKVILAVGRVAAQTVLVTDTPIGKLREQQHEVGGIPVIATYHPAYLLRKPVDKRKAWQDLLSLQALLN